MTLVTIIKHTQKLVYVVEYQCYMVLIQTAEEVAKNISITT